MIEQRRQVRIRDENPLSITYSQGAAGRGVRRNLQVVSRDISEGGIRLRTPDFVAVGTRLQVEIYFSSPVRTVALNGVVKWVREVPELSGYEVGVEFEVTDSEVGELLRRYVESKASR